MNLGDHPQDYINRINAALQNVNKAKLAQLTARIEAMIGANSTLFIAGNGGSAATASHMACDLAKTILGKNPRANTKRLKVLSLNDNIPLITAWGNDEGYEYIFSEQLKNLGKTDDLLLLITGSGNSKNMLEAALAAKQKGVKTFAFLGFAGGKLKELVDDYILVESDDYWVIEDLHMIFVHLITDWLKKQ